MSADQPPKNRSTLHILALLSRWLLGGCFVYMGMVKAVQPFQFVETIRQYDMVSSNVLLNSIGALLPWFEVFCGLLLIAGVAVRGTALIMIAMLIPFTIVVFHRAMEMAAATHTALCAIKFDCGCGGGEMFACRKVMENSGLLLLACCLIALPGRRFCLRYSLTPDLTGADQPSVPHSTLDPRPS